MKSVLIRVIISLFLCCCIVLNVVSLPARALDPVTVGYSAVAVTVAVACALQALGYMSASNSQTFTDTVNSASQYMSANSAWVDDGLVLAAGLIGTQNGFLPVGFVQQLWQWLFDTNTVYVSGLREPSSLTGLGVLSYSQALSYASQCQYCFTYEDGDSRGVVAFKGNKGSFTFSEGVIRVYNSYTSAYYWDSSTSGKFKSWPYAYDFVKLGGVQISNPGLVSTSQDVTLGQIQSPYLNVGTDEEIIEIQFGVVYEDWVQKVEEFPNPNDPDGDDPDNDGKYPMWLPTGIPSPGYDDSVITQNQQQAQSGVVSGDITFEPFEPSNPGSGNGSGNTGTNTGTNFLESLTQFFTPSGDITMYSLDLKELFPFCIPFDIYNFLAALSADPVAPVFEFDLNLGVATEPMKIDLSNWSDLAAIIRTLELGLFCVGLALKTRELIGG